MSAPAPVAAEVLIIGAGVFGLSTALALLSRPAFSHAHITVLDGSPALPNPAGSSVDASRIVRADYACASYAALALQAQTLWRDRGPDGWGGEHRYHEPGFLLTADVGKEAYLRQSLANVRDLAERRVEGLQTELVEELGNQEAIRRAWRGGRRGAEGEGECRGATVGGGVSGDVGYVNWSSGWADAEACVRYALERVRREGRDRLSLRAGCQVRRLLYRASPGLGSTAIGAELESGEQVLADLVVVAAGAWSPTLVNLQGRAVATGQALVYFDISEEEQRAMQDRPTIMNMSRGMFIIPPRGRELKIARHGFGYRNLKQVVVHDGYQSGQTNGPMDVEGQTIEVSVPAVGVEVPIEAQKACREALRELVPEMADRAFSRTRICWYCDTPDGDFLIDYHPTHAGLFLATGGSGHGFKFFPVIGEKIADAIERKLDTGLQQLWRWKAEKVDGLTCTEDGSRSGPRGMILDEELQRKVR